MAIEKLNLRADSEDERFAQLKQLYPELFSDGNLNVEALKEACGLETEEDGYYGLYWPGKNEAKRLARKEASGTLEPVEGDGVNEDTTHNIYIEGDNLEVLRTLKKSYQNRVKMIYIDPPYNTGEDFVYSDKYEEPIEQYLRFTQQIDEEGNILIANPRTSGKYHRRWLDMMYSRLLVAHTLLKDDGIIFISMDDHEIANLRLICDEIFGEGNFQGHIHWRRRHNQPNDKTKLIGIVAEHILVYTKDATKYKESGVGKLELTATFTNPDNDPKGPWASKPWKVGSDQSGSRYKITAPNGNILEEEWMGEEKTYKKFLAEGRIYFPRGGDGMPRKKYYQFEREEEGQCATNWFIHEQFGHNQGANDCLTELFDGQKNVFSNPKPIELINSLIRLSNAKNGDIILDFFSGSASTAHAMFINNINSQNKKKFIMIQLPVDCSKEKESKDFLSSINKPVNICEIGKERIRRVGKKILEKEGKDNSLDVGFKVYRLAKSNFTAFENISGTDKAALDTLFAAAGKEPLTEGWKERKSSVVAELCLRHGFVLDSQITKCPEYTKNEVLKIVDQNEEKTMFICLDEKINPETAKTLHLEDGEKFICLDNAIGDQLKVQLADKGRIETI